MRVVSVLPSATEVVFALGHGPELLGRSAECDWPPGAQRLPVVMWPRTDDRDRPSGEIDARVRRERDSGASLYRLDVDRLRSLRPDLLLTQDLCGVCSVTGDEVARACAEAGVHPRILSLSPTRLEDVWSSFEAIAEALGDAAAGRGLVAQCRSHVRPPRSGPRPRVAVVEWLDPPIVAGLWTPALVDAAGGQYVGPEPGAPGERTTWAELAGRDLDLLVLSPCSFAVERTMRELEDPALARAVLDVRPRGRTVVADEAYFSRPGPRLAFGIDLIHRFLREGREPLPMPFALWGEGAVEATA